MPFRDLLRNEPETTRILLVEDDPGDVLITRESLAESRLPCDLSVVGDGAAALDYLHKRGDHADAPTPHLVLLDLNLPKVSGREVLAEAKGTPALAHIPIVVLTTSSSCVTSIDLRSSVIGASNHSSSRSPGSHPVRSRRVGSLPSRFRSAGRSELSFRRAVSPCSRAPHSP